MALTLILSTGCSVFGIGSEEQPKYQVVLKDDDKEIRQYEGFIIAKTTIKGSFKEAQSEGFRILAGYIFGKNQSNQKIAMTAPVVQKSTNEKISMTAPVTMVPAEDRSWTMTFSMPSKYSLESLPTPEDSRVVLEKVAPRFVAAITFTGFWGEEKNAQKASLLKEWMMKQTSYELSSEAMFAGYNPPWTLPFFRRNEMLIELKQK